MKKAISGKRISWLCAMITLCDVIIAKKEKKNDCKFLLEVNNIHTINKSFVFLWI